MIRLLSGDNRPTMRFRISVLGTSVIRDHEGRRIDSVLQQPRRFALLVYLTMESRSGPVRRDTVLGLFWPEKPQDKARGSLNQAIHYLRRSLGTDAIRTQADLLEVNREVVSCDASEFLKASDEGRWAAGAKLYGGELLPGYFDSGSSPDFEYWLEAARGEIREKAACCAWALAEEEAARGDSPGAVVWARRAWEWSRCEEAQTRRLMEMLDRLGDRGGVVEAYDALCRSLEELGATPASATRDLLADLKERWAREGEAATPIGQPAGGTGRKAAPAGGDTGSRGGMAPGPGDQVGGDPRGPVPTPGETSRGWPWSLALRKVASVVVTVGLTVGLLSLWGVTRFPSSPAIGGTVVVIEPMVSDEGGAAVSEMLRGEVMTQLQEMTRLRVVGGADPDVLVRERGFVLKGNLLAMGDELQGSFRLVDGESGTALAGTSLEQAAPELPEALDAMARSVAHFVRQQVGAALEERRLLEANVPRQAIVAMALGKQDMALGASLWRDNSDDAAIATYQKADSMFTEAAHLAPRWDLPWISRAETSYRLMWIERRREGGSRSVEEALAEQGLRFADEALARQGEQAESLELRALFHEWLWLLSQPDPSGHSADVLAKAEEAARRATEVDPYRARAWNVLGAALLYRGEWAEAYWALGRAVEADTDLGNDTEILFRLFTAAWESGNANAARAWCSLLGERSRQGWPVVNCQLHLLADTETPSLQRVEELRRQAEQWSYWPSVAAQFDALAAVLHARAGDREGAQAILSRLLEAPPDSELPYLVAWALLELGEKERARGQIAEYVATYPAAPLSVLGSRRLRGREGSE
jgi:DNA-binding SARP family transcriptional activator/tetratricopeptide (TPR) repeat protein